MRLQAWPGRALRGYEDAESTERQKERRKGGSPGAKERKGERAKEREGERAKERGQANEKRNGLDDRTISERRTQGAGRDKVPDPKSTQRSKKVPSVPLLPLLPSLPSENNPSDTPENQG